MELGQVQVIAAGYFASMAAGKLIYAYYCSKSIDPVDMDELKNSYRYMKHGAYNLLRGYFETLLILKIQKL